MAHQYSATYCSVDERQAWSPGWVARLPWLGIGALIGSVLGIVASVAVLIASNGRPISEWRIQPTVWLSVASTASNIMLHYALTEGVNMAWWRRAMKPQTQVGDLHRNWAFETSVWSAITAGRYVNLVALASILTAIVPINNPLLQRASRVTSGALEVASPATLTVSIAPAIPSGFTGLVSGRQHAASLFTPEYIMAVQNYYNGTATQLTVPSGCQGTCQARVQGVGLAVNCSSYTSPFNLEPSTEKPYNASNDPAVINGTYVFQSYFDWIPFSGNMSLNIQYKDASPCTGNLFVRNCTIQTALVSYPVLVDSNSTIKLQPDTTIFDDIVEQKINNFYDGTVYGSSTLGGYYLALKNKFNSDAHLRWVGAAGYELLTTGSTATQYAITNVTTTSGGFGIGSSCELSFTDPTFDLIASARDLMFRTALAAANSSTVQQVAATQISTPAIYVSDYKYLAIAVALTALAVIAVTSTFHGYWHLGRSVTMSPLETAKAFRAPLLEHADSNATIKALMRELGERSVRYGAVREEASMGRELYTVGKEGAQARAQYTSGGSARMRLRLEMAEERLVEVPEKGCKFLA